MFCEMRMSVLPNSVSELRLTSTSANTVKALTHQTHIKEQAALKADGCVA